MAQNIRGEAYPVNNLIHLVYLVDLVNLVEQSEKCETSEMSEKIGSGLFPFSSENRILPWRRSL